MAVEWRVYYADDSAFGSEEGHWDDAPIDGVVMIAVRNGERVDFYSGSDHYAALDDETIASLDDLHPTLREYAKWIKHGVWTTHSNYRRIQERALEEFKRQA